MENNWSEWELMPSGKELIFPGLDKKAYGIYQIQVINRQSEAIPIHRIGGVDEKGVIYIGRSGYSNSSTSRTLLVRLKEFILRKHSGAWTYFFSRCTNCWNQGVFKGHKLCYSVKCLSGSKEEIDDNEGQAIGEYFDKFGELPPLNSIFPKKGSYFEKKFGDLRNKK